MSNNSKFTIQLLEKIGAPLTAAVNHVLSEGDDKEVEAAQIMAQLLGQATQMSTALYNILEIKEDEAQADSTRLALAALVSPLVAEAYKHRKQVLSEENIDRIGKSLEALISFGESFSPAADHQSRLQTIDHGAVLFDKEQPSLVVLQAMVPVVNAVEEFSFGQSRIKLVQDISTKLESLSVEMATKIGAADKLKELIIFKSLAALYTSCHLAETGRAASSNDVELSLDSVWESFATKLSMMEALMGFEGDAVPAPSSKEPSTKTEAEIKKEAPATTGPMGFFKKDDKPKVEEEAPAVLAVEASKETSAPVAVEEKKADEAPPSSPMGFFKPGVKKEEETKT